jgi:hypothetical protein
MTKSKRNEEGGSFTALKKRDVGRIVQDTDGSGSSKHTVYAWKAKYGGMDAREVQAAGAERREPTLEC